MAMEDPRVLLHTSMSFNPFRHTHPSSPPVARPAPQQRTAYDPYVDDSWHTNVGLRRNSRENESRSPQHHQRTSSARSWFSSWATTSTTSPRSKTITRTAAVASSAIIIHDDPPTSNNNHSASMPPAVSSPHPHRPLSYQTAPARSMTMNRGADTPKTRKTHQTVISHDAHHQSISPLPLHDEKAVGGGTSTIPQNDSDISPHIKASVDPNEVDDNGLGGLPPYPELKKAPQKQAISPTRRDSQLLEEFPTPESKSTNSSTNSATAEKNIESHAEPKKASQRQMTYPKTHPTRGDSQLLEEFPKPKTKATNARVARTKIELSSKPAAQFRHKQIFEESTFPGFALFQMAKAQYCLGRYSEALDTTTACLSFQKKSFDGNKGCDGSAAMGSNARCSAAAAANDKKGIGNGQKKTVSHNPANSPAGSVRKGSGDANDTMTALDLRSTFVTGVGSSVLGVVKSLKESSETAMAGGGLKSRKTPQHHPMLSNSIAAMVARHPSHPCVARTLLLRGRLLAECGVLEFGEDAIRHAEMAVAIQRTLVISDDEELAAPLLFLADMKTRLGHYEDADVAYKEAIFILGEVRSGAKNDHSEAVKRGDDDVAAECEKYLKRITGEIATALFLHGKSYHCQRRYGDAFECYMNALILLGKTGESRNNASVRSVARCMKSRCALEKLVSGYWDDSGVI